MREGLIDFLENQHDREPLCSVCVLVHAAWRIEHEELEMSVQLHGYKDAVLT